MAQPNQVTLAPLRSLYSSLALAVYKGLVHHETKPLFRDEQATSVLCVFLFVYCGSRESESDCHGGQARVTTMGGQLIKSSILQRKVLIEPTD